MSSFKGILYVMYTVLFILTVLMVFYNESMIATFGSDGMYSFWMIWALVGFVLLMLESVLENVIHSRVSRSNKKLLQENNELKAKMYDEMMRSRQQEMPTISPENPPRTNPS